MNWDAIGAIGEIVGAIAVVASLAYLAIQVRQNSKSLDRSNEYSDAASIHDSQIMYSACFSQLANDRELADIYHRLEKGEMLEGVEYVRAAAFLVTYFVWMEKLFLQAERNVGYTGYTDIETSELYTVTGPYVAKLLRTPVGKRWWEEDAPHHFMNYFLQSVEKYLSAQNGAGALSHD